MIPPTFTEETKREFREKFMAEGQVLDRMLYTANELESFFLSRTESAYDLGFKDGKQANRDAFTNKWLDDARAEGRAETLKEVREMCEGMKEEIPTLQAMGGQENEGTRAVVIGVLNRNKILSDLITRLMQ